MEMEPAPNCWNVCLRSTEGSGMVQENGENTGEALGSFETLKQILYRKGGNWPIRKKYEGIYNEEGSIRK